MFSELFHDSLVLFLLLFSFRYGGFVLLRVRHRHHGQDQIDEVERAQKDDDHEEDHVGLPGGPEGLKYSRHFSVVKVMTDINLIVH